MEERVHVAVDGSDAVEVRLRGLDRGDLTRGELAREVGGAETDQLRCGRPGTG